MLVTFLGTKALAPKRSNEALDDFVDGIDDGVTDGVRIEVLRITKLILKHEGTNALDLVTRRGKSKPTVERYLRTAKEVGIVEFKGAPKTSRYYLSSKF